MSGPHPFAAERAAGADASGGDICNAKMGWSGRNGPAALADIQSGPAGPPMTVAGQEAADG